MTWSRSACACMAASPSSACGKGAAEPERLKRIANQSWWRMNTGANAMLRTKATSIGCTTAASISRCCNTIPNSNSANSPPCPSIMPVRQASSAERREARNARKLSPIFMGTQASTQANTASGAATNCTRSNCKPMVTKNKPESTSRNGLRCSSMWCRKSLSPSTMPARNAPRAADTPSACAAPAAATTTESETSTKASSCPRRATQPNNVCSRRRETTADTPNSNSTPRTSSTTPPILVESPLAQIATRASSGTLASILSDLKPANGVPAGGFS